MHTKTYSQHLRDAKGCGHRWRILTLKDSYRQSSTCNLSAIRIVPVRCNSKSCPTCSNIYFRKIRHRFKDNLITNQWRFFTLTTVHKKNSIETELEHLENSFRELRKHLRRQNKNFLYFAVKELSPSGMWHIHGVWNMYIDIKELSALWLKYSGAYRVDVRKLHSPKGAINYLFKYIFKSAYNEDEKRYLYECDKRKFSYSRQLFSKTKVENPYSCDLGIDYSVPELKDKLYEIIGASDHNIDDFVSDEYPYFTELIENLFHLYYNEHPPNLFETRLASLAS